MADSNLPESPLAHLPPTREPSSPLVDEGRMAEEERDMHLRALAPVIALIGGLLVALTFFLLKPELVRRPTGGASGSPSGPQASDASGRVGMDNHRSGALAHPSLGSSEHDLRTRPTAGLRTLEVFLDDSMARREGGAAPIDDLWVTVGALREPAHGAQAVWTLSKFGSEVLDVRSGGLRFEVPKAGTVHLSIVCRRGSEHLVYTAFLQDAVVDVLHLAPTRTRARLTFDRPGHVDPVRCAFQVLSSCEADAAGAALPERHPVPIDVRATLDSPDFAAEFIGLPGDYRMGSFLWSPNPSENLRPADLATVPEFEWTPPMTTTTNPRRR